MHGEARATFYAGRIVLLHQVLEDMDAVLGPFKGIRLTDTVVDAEVKALREDRERLSKRVRGVRTTLLGIDGAMEFAEAQIASLEATDADTTVLQMQMWQRALQILKVLGEKKEKRKAEEDAAADAEGVYQDADISERD